MYYIIDSGFKLASYVCIISVTSTSNRYVSLVALQARIYFNSETKHRKTSYRDFHILWRWKTYFLIPPCCAYNTWVHYYTWTVCLKFWWYSIEQIHSTFCIPFHIILGANTLRYEVPSAVRRVRFKDSWSDRNNSEWNLVFCCTVSLLCVTHQTWYHMRG